MLVYTSLNKWKLYHIGYRNKHSNAHSHNIVHCTIGVVDIIRTLTRSGHWGLINKPIIRSQSCRGINSCSGSCSCIVNILRALCLWMRDETAWNYEQDILIFCVCLKLQQGPAKCCRNLKCLTTHQSRADIKSQKTRQTVGRNNVNIGFKL